MRGRWPSQRWPRFATFLHQSSQTQENLVPQLWKAKLSDEKRKKDFVLMQAVSPTFSVKEMEEVQIESAPTNVIEHWNPSLHFRGSNRTFVVNCIHQNLFLKYWKWNRIKFIQRPIQKNYHVSALKIFKEVFPPRSPMSVIYFLDWQSPPFPLPCCIASFVPILGPCVSSVTCVCS